MYSAISSHHFIFIHIYIYNLLDIMHLKFPTWTFHCIWTFYQIVFVSDFLLNKNWIFVFLSFCPFFSIAQIHFVKTIRIGRINYVCLMFSSSDVETKKEKNQNPNQKQKQNLLIMTLKITRLTKFTYSNSVDEHRKSKK